MNQERLNIIWQSFGVIVEHAFKEAIRSAVLAERERCAKVAESFIPSGFTGEGKAGNSYAVARDDRARTIAAKIREDIPK